MVKRYFPVWRFAFSWCWLKGCYLLSNPYQCSRRYIAGRPDEDELLYGETPLTALETIMNVAGVTSEDHVVELGAGSGYTSLWLGCVLGCQVTAIERVPVFCWRLQRTANRFHLGVDVRCENFLDTDLSEATVIYLYGSALSEETIIQLGIKFSQLEIGTKVITVSYALTELCEYSCFRVTSRLTVSFDWGDADVFIHDVTAVG